MSDVPAESAVMRRALVQKLRGWRAAGVTHVPRATIEMADAAPAVEDHPAATEGPAMPPRPTRSKDSEPQPAPAAAPAEDRAARLAALARRVAACTRCRELAATRTQTVFGVGDPQARVMFIGEAPGADEDRQGEPFVGRAGQLLNRIIAACGWQREDLYICNILRCRPPGNRTPSNEEAANCREWLDGQIQTIDPEYIVCWGSVAAKNLLGTEESIGKLRQRWFQHGRAKVLCTYHPSYLLRNPEAKLPVWEDMKLLLKEMGLEAPKASG